jgi:hypothetical protein
MEALALQVPLRGKGRDRHALDGERMVVGLILEKPPWQAGSTGTLRSGRAPTRVTNSSR